MNLHVLKPPEWKQTTSNCTCSSITAKLINSHQLHVIPHEKKKKQSCVCFCCRVQWGWHSLPPQTNLEELVLSAFYEENPPGDESWKYSLWQERSCETGRWWPGWTFDGELWFHWAFYFLKVNIIKSGLPWRVWNKIIISGHSGFAAVKWTFVMQNKSIRTTKNLEVFLFVQCLLSQKTVVKQTSLTNL